ncbi:P-loop containing nucleoside triphosphate hydrolase protein [Halteromyces radiatus]|uniref:P-loop containing nucleoside triphosphate hydrolase protein n=1 Tax=Halteromyces radiatus TaxID=101107 RepID=UPI00222046C1|nr:P-loop containing nucleoside triphosphate hydrolase protein [Halteromyces radiatus]KAI8085172.1 P-loop containing nucleoside triphosphate hydrolase protein [Halteromyces radiatus]
MNIKPCPTDDLALTNYVYVAPGQLDPSCHFILVDDHFAFTVRPDNNIPRGVLVTNGMHRKWAQFSNDQPVVVMPYDPYANGAEVYLGLLRLEIDYRKKSVASSADWDTDQLAQVFGISFINQIFTSGQQFVFDFQGTQFLCRVMELEVVDMDVLKAGRSHHGFDPERTKYNGAPRGILMHQTTVEFTKAHNSLIRLKGSKKASGARSQAKQLIRADFKFEDLGIGGLDDEFSAIFRRAFASRIFPPSIVEKLGVQHVKGLLLYGPPGTGKTLMARQIGKMLNAKEPKIISGPEVLSKFVGQSEENVRKLFADAEAEYKSKGEDSGLHIIIFDELDAICKQRGSRGDSTGVGDSVVNQLLAKMDGVEQLNNILIIGMTNRKDMIDEALLRPGRLEVHMEVGLPDENGRQQILKIHTAKMRESKILDQDVSISELAELTKNYSGAEISGVVKAASSYAFSRHIKVGTVAGVAPDVENMKVNMSDFLSALEEVPPAFGVSEAELQQLVQNGIIPFARHIDSILKDGVLYVDQVRQSAHTPMVSILLHGAAGSGKSALAATMAIESAFPFIKLISPETMVGMTENAKINEINKVFNDSYKSPLSVIVIDNIERLLDWVDIGPRFSNAILQALLVLLKKPPPKDRRLLIIATTSQRSILKQMDMIDAFASEIQVPTITSLSEIDIVLQKMELFNEQERSDALIELGTVENMTLSIGIKKLLMVIEMARQDTDKVSKFVNTISDLCRR